MRTVYELNKSDIEKIISEHFNVKESKVYVYTEDEIVGYGTGEQKEKVIHGRVVIE